MALLWATLLVALFVYALYELLNIQKRKRFPPGPRGLPILGHLHLLGKNPHQDLQKLANKHGPIMYMRLGLVPAIVASSADAAEKVLKTNDHIFASRPHHEASQYMAYGQKNFIFAKYGPYWRNIRKLCTVHLLSSHKINSFQSMRKQQVQLLIDSLKREAHDRIVVDLSAKITSLNANLTCLMVFGKKYMDEDLDKRGFKAVVQDVLHLAATPNLGDFFPFLGVIDLQGLTRKLKDLSKVFDEFLEKIIDEHVQSHDQKQTKDFVDTMMEIMQSGEAEFQFDRRHIKAILLDMLMAAMDTSATSVEWILTELLRHPNVMKKLQKELDEVVGIERMVEESDLENLKYLDMVVKEGLRLHSVVPIMHHEAMEDCVVDGFHIQKGSRIMINCYAVQRDPNVWPEPEKFFPERFVGSSVDIRGRDFQLLPFGSGRRSCPGMQLGVTIVRLVVAQLVHCFDWEIPNGMQPLDLEIDEQFGLVTCKEKPLMAIPTYRLKEDANTLQM
nr:cytochrome P450 CYP736A12-like [Nicotiana tomentosiformis]